MANRSPRSARWSSGIRACCWFAAHSPRIRVYGQFPGESLQQSAEREVLEETGVHIRAGEPVHSFDLIEYDERGRLRFHYVIIDLLAAHVAGEPVAGDDASEAAWVSPKTLENRGLCPQTHALLARLRFGKTADKTLQPSS